MNCNKTIGTEMPEIRNNSQTNAEQGGEKSPGTSADAFPENGEKTGSFFCGAKSVLNLIWKVVNAILDYVDGEIPEKTEPPKSKIGKMWVGFNDWLDSFATASPEKADASGSRRKSKWAQFNALLDSLEEPESEPSVQSLPDNPAKRGSLLKKTGSFCWEIVFHSAIVVFLFVFTMFATVKTLDYVNSRHVPFYPSDEVRQYLSSEHEALEAVVDGLPLGKDRNDNIPADSFGEQCAAILKPVRIYSDDYGVYLMTSKNWYVGENGIFIARDKDNMPDDMSWGLIEGRVYAYAFLK